MDKLGVEIVLNSRVLGSQVDTANKQTILTLSNGETLTAGKVIFCTAKPTARTDWLPSTVLDENGYVRVNSDTTHFAAGDIAAWGGIKRVGGALIMGQCAAINIVKRIVADEQNQLEASIQPEQQTLPPFPQMMSLAVGSEAVSFGPDGSVKTGEEVREMAFGDDLGLTRVREVLGFTKS
ncbi:Pyridine nucleotide-disulfide oxidoreductase [Aspergillus sclerotialis]|uniref:Pyridine nucleotide-disulfide oxidoreductase n=1 Tax=Aspergillus sclerotialis TaxID=2070753 RepID=A0A3A2ZJV4_9EURO|nr:Pyridine nucleotide-disulfide oxidoreductase [Aspergillus sclerotialis]